jgi:L-gulono-1,4-lactone dehydrogenase
MEIIRAAIETCAGAAAMPPDTEKQLRDAGCDDALVALRGRYLHHYPVFCRRVMPEDTLVSMAASVDAPLVSISLFTYDRPEQRESYYAFCAWLARTLLRLCDARPHWGKHFPLDHAEIARLYPRMDEFRSLCGTVDPGGVFRNAYTARVLNLQPGRADRPMSQGGAS